jgi:hypothetical protein
MAKSKEELLVEVQEMRFKDRARQYVENISASKRQLAADQRRLDELTIENA